MLHLFKSTIGTCVIPDVLKFINWRKSIILYYPYIDTFCVYGLVFRVDIHLWTNCLKSTKVYIKQFFFVCVIRMLQISIILLILRSQHINKLVHTFCVFGMRSVFCSLGVACVVYVVLVCDVCLWVRALEKETENIPEIILLENKIFHNYKIHLYFN